MKTYQCVVCAWKYEEAKGDPGQGVAPGTAWGSAKGISRLSGLNRWSLDYSSRFLVVNHKKSRRQS